jgi:hypothetical protein
MSNVKFWCERRGIAADEALCKAILDAAKASPETLTEQQIRAVVAARSQGG